ncbi:hypothetical protein FMM05_03985 [Flavobacterium zepuense]|uniref:Uncharacterized protein n=1 Tax=Flavobacterium zepuense TaxID=2593302 RepID=A0A552V7V1_9FLAO|nr:hypothetical protein [Flavobacterium zepuense]TRW26546.1 hypothetical protein FMM05_03985 [Flavobacterium zepuense]
MKMEPNNIEQDFKQKLEQRTIQPTEMAWDRLDAMLSVTEEKKSKKPNRNWMYMAACFLALLLVGVLFLNQEKQNTINGTNTNGNSVVTTQQSVTPSKIENDATVAPQPVTVTQEAVATTNTAKPLKKRSQQISKMSNTATTETRVYTNNEQVAVNNENTVAPVIAKPGKIKVDANELLASVDRNSVSGPKQHINSTKIKQDGVKVNPNSLLTSVEGELNQSFRDKVLETVSKNYNTVKSSLATRNHQ